jgi:hypothetical protein
MQQGVDVYTCIGWYGQVHMVVGSGNGVAAAEIKNFIAALAVGTLVQFILL